VANLKRMILKMDDGRVKEYKGGFNGVLVFNDGEVRHIWSAAEGPVVQPCRDSSRVVHVDTLTEVLKKLAQPNSYATYDNNCWTLHPGDEPYHIEIQELIYLGMVDTSTRADEILEAQINNRGLDRIERKE